MGGSSASSNPAAAAQSQVARLRAANSDLSEKLGKALEEIRTMRMSL